MKCIDAKKMIDQYLDGELSPIRSRAFESHCTQCSSCANELALAKKIRKTLKAFPVVKAPKGFESKVHARISKREKRTFAKIFFYPRHIKIPLEVAALFVIALLVTIHPDSIMFGDKIMKESSPDAQMKWENEVPSVAEDKMAPSAPRAVSKSKTARKEIAGKDRSFHADKFAGSNPPSPAKDLEVQKGASTQSASRAQVSDEKRSREELAGAASSPEMIAKKSAVAREPDSARPNPKTGVSQMIQDAGGSVIESTLSADGSSVTVRFTLPLEKLEKLLENFSAAGITVKSSPVIGAKNVIRIELYSDRK